MKENKLLRLYPVNSVNNFVLLLEFAYFMKIEIVDEIVNEACFIDSFST